MSDVGAVGEGAKTDEEKVMADSGVAATVSVSLHPLVIMNISEHWTRSVFPPHLSSLYFVIILSSRTKAQEGRPMQVYGALIGKQNGRDIELMNSFELDHTTVDGCVIIDREYYNTKEEQFKQVFSDMDFLGWYSTGEHPSMNDITVHKQISEINESPLFLQLTPGKQNNTELPVCLYESVIDMFQGEETHCHYLRVSNISHILL